MVIWLEHRIFKILEERASSDTKTFGEVRPIPVVEISEDDSLGSCVTWKRDTSLGRLLVSINHP
jgi:hypothetical protein